MPEIDPGEHDLAELTGKLQAIEDPGELEAILEAEREGEDRENVVTVIESRLETVRGEEDGAFEAETADPAEMTAAEVANAVRDVDDADALRGLLEREREGEDRSTVVSQIESRIESIEGGDEEAEYVPPEEKHPDLEHPTAEKRWVEGSAGETYRDMWVFCETQAGDLVTVSRELLGKARELMDDYNAEYDEEERVVAVLIGDDVSKHAEEAIACGADLVVYREDPRLERFQLTPYTEVFCDMARADADWRDYHEPRYTVFPATNNGRDLSATVQGELDSGLASDCSGLYIDRAMISNPAKTGTPGESKEFERVLHMKRPDFSGFEYSTILCLDKPHRDFHPQGASVIPGSFDPPEPDPQREGEVIEWDCALDEEWFSVSVTDHDLLEGGVDLTGHDVVVCMGRGIGRDPTRGMELGLELSEQFEDAALGITRGIVTSSYEFDGHVERYTKEERQIGETGQVVEPDLYVAAGVSGAIQHKVGMDESDTVIAINTNEDADIRDFSDYYVHGDLFEVIPAMVEALEAGEPMAAIADGGRVVSGDDEGRTADPDPAGDEGVSR